MATSKTLTPTNQTIAVPALTDSPDISVPADAIDKEADAINALDSNVGTIHSTSEITTMADFISLINQTASGLFVNCRIGTTVVSKLCGVSKHGLINAFKSSASSDYIEYTVVDSDGKIYSGYYAISSDTASYTGVVTGASSSTDGTIPLFDGTTGKALKAGKTITDVTSSTAIANNANMPTNRTVRNCIYNGLDKTAAGFALDARQAANLYKVKNVTNGGVTTIKITTASTLDAKDLFLIMHRNSDNGLTLVSGGGVVNNIVNSSSAGLTASVSGNTITMTGNNLYYARVTVIGGVNFTLSAGS